MESWEIKGHMLEFDEDIHQYIVDGVCVPSITQILKVKFRNKYDGIDQAILKRASEKGTELHEAIEKLCKYGEVSELKEVKNFMFLQSQYKFEVIDNEVPVILFENDIPIGAGRLDLLVKMDGEIGLADIKRTYTLDKEYLGYQLNLYRIACQQSYGMKIDFLKGIHLREDKRRLVKIPINEEMTMELLEELRKENENKSEINDTD